LALFMATVAALASNEEGAFEPAANEGSVPPALTDCRWRVSQPLEVLLTPGVPRSM
jgi:hypothetical protein